MQALDSSTLGRFESLAPAALAARESGGQASAWAAGGIAVASGLGGLVAAYAFDGSRVAAVAYLFWVVWVGAFGDLLRWLLFRRAVRRMAERISEERYVWCVVDALRRGRDRFVQEHAAPYRPGIGLLVEFGLGAAGTIALLGMLDDHNLVDEFFDGTPGEAMHMLVGWGIAFLLVPLVNLAGVVLDAVRVRRADGHAEVRIDAGARGFGVFLLVFPVIALQSMGVAAIDALLVAGNLGLLLVGAVGIYGAVVMAREARWLRGHLARRGRATSPAP